ncbi:hypothetical protein LSH36_1024g00003 [Paralvinella palmiformis]|uniref:G-protein coupled receptors family 1 profile domain-containing protein n=1 Tax=Paralvinella palmiformis TaxID=53620 RepID=A0AAD9IXI7_9ANNE|nr:hypothetical protein LSH36_1024g00003 [Paralvinella palmiformis]
MSVTFLLQNLQDDVHKRQEPPSATPPCVSMSRRYLVTCCYVRVHGAIHRERYHANTTKMTDTANDEALQALHDNLDHMPIVRNPALMYINGFIFYSRNGFAIGHVIALTVYRYSMIVRPNIYKILSRTSVMVLTLILLFVIPLCGAVGTLSHRLIFNTKVMFCVTEKSLGITNNRLTEDVSRTSILPFFLYIILNSIILVGCNVHIYLYIRKSSKRTGGTNSNRIKKNNETKVSRRSPSKEARFVKIMTIMFSMFLVCYFPIPIAMTTDPKWDLSHWIYLPLLLINWFSSSVSWVIFIITHTAFRIAVLRRIKCSPVIEFQDSTSVSPEDDQRQCY